MTKTWLAWTIGILGAWLFVAAFLNFDETGNMWDNLIVGIIVGIAGFAIIKTKTWQGWTAGLLGIWLIIAAFIPSLQTHESNMWNGIIVGILLMIAGFAALGKQTGEVAHST